MKKVKKISVLQILASALYIATLLMILIFLWQSWHQ